MIFVLTEMAMVIYDDSGNEGLARNARNAEFERTSAGPPDLWTIDHRPGWGDFREGAFQNRLAESMGDFEPNRLDLIRTLFLTGSPSAVLFSPRLLASPPGPAIKAIIDRLKEQYGPY